LVIVLETLCGASQKIEADTTEDLPDYIQIYYSDGFRYFKRFVPPASYRIMGGIYLYQEVSSKDISNISMGPKNIWKYEKQDSNWVYKQSENVSTWDNRKSSVNPDLIIPHIINNKNS
jgi:hypothetical protein